MAISTSIPSGLTTAAVAKKTTETLSAGSRWRVSQQVFAGFTLIELLAVLVILAVTSAVVAPRVDNAINAARSKAVVRDILHLANSARRQAIKSASEVVLEVDIANHQVSVAGQESGLQLPEFLPVEITAAKSEQRTAQRAGVRFFADGSATGGRIVLGPPGGPRYFVDVDWLTGVASIGGESE